ncbi:uncharacterized protein LOC135948413 isoform X2 [Cloeon dipterum]
MSQFCTKTHSLATRQATQFRWLTTQEDDFLPNSHLDDVDSSGAAVSHVPALQHQTFTQIDFPSFTQLVADDDKVFKMPDPYKPPPEPKSPRELSELAWVALQQLPHKDAILQDLIYTFENSKVDMKRTLRIGLLAPLTAEPFLKTFLRKCPLLEDGEFSSSESSQSDGEEESDESLEEEAHPVLLRGKSGLTQLDITHDLDISSSEEELMDFDEVPKPISPDMPEGSLTAEKVSLDMPNLEGKTTVGTQTVLTMEDIERLLKSNKSHSRDSQLSQKPSVVKSNQQIQQAKARQKKKSTVRIGLSRVRKQRVGKL